MFGIKTQNAEDEVAKLRSPVSPSQATVDALPLTVSSNEKRKILQQSPHLLQAIEKTLVACVHEQLLVDDQVVVRALASSILRHVDEAEVVAFVIAKLALTAVELNVDDQQWRDSLRLIYTAVRNQSDLEPGEYSYLIYTSSMNAKNAN